MAEVLLDPSLIEIELDIEDKEEGLYLLSRKLQLMDLVEEGFYGHLLERETNYPTGLPTAIPVALCHTEAQYVKRSALAVATLKQPVAFGEMGNPDHVLPVQVIFLLALVDPKDQVPWLKKMVLLFKAEEALKKIRNAKSKEAICEYLKDSLSIVGRAVNG